MRDGGLLFKTGIIFCLLTLLFSPFLYGAEDETVLLKKSQLLVQKASKAEERGEIEDAVATYEEAIDICPRNILPLLKLGRLLAQVGMYEKAAERLNAIPLERLPAAGQSEVHLLIGQIAIAHGSVEEAAAALSKSVKAMEGNDIPPLEVNNIARVRLAALNKVFGLSIRAEKLLHEYDLLQDLPPRELRLALLIDLQLGNLGSAYHACGLLGKFADPKLYEEGSRPALLWLSKITPLLFLTFLSLSLNGVLGIIYFSILFSGLVFTATRFSAPTATWHNVAFVVAAVLTMLGGQWHCSRDLFIAAMQDDFSANDSVWILPKLLISGHLVAVALYFVFPAFKILPEEQRPRRYELYGIWFFCWFFMVFVLVFQSRLGFTTRAVYMAISAVLAALTCVIMPLGRFVLFKVASTIGYTGLAGVNRQDLQNTDSISFTDAKILESKAWKLLEKDEFDEVIMTGRKVMRCLDRKTFPSFWKALILALICREDFVEAKRNVVEFIEVFKDSSVLESGQLYDALIRSRQGDFAGALKIIRSMPDNRVKSFSHDENALSLLILGRCGLAYKENVQAHIDLGKAINCAKMPLIKAEALVETTELDYNMKARDALSKWQLKISEISGGEKTSSCLKVVSSIIASFEGKKSEAMKLAMEACNSKVRNSRASAWLGHLLCCEGRSSEAEELLNKMTPESVDATRLMNEVTGSGA